MLSPGDISELCVVGCVRPVVSHHGGVRNPRQRTRPRASVSGDVDVEVAGGLARRRQVGLDVGVGLRRQIGFRNYQLFRIDASVAEKR